MKTQPNPVYFSDPTGLAGQSGCSWCNPVADTFDKEIMDAYSRQPSIGSLFDGYTGGSFQNRGRVSLSAGGFDRGNEFFRRSRQSSFIEEINTLVPLLGDGVTPIPILSPVTVEEARAGGDFLQVRIDAYYNSVTPLSRHDRTMNNALVRAQHKAQREFANNPFGGAFLTLVSAGAVGGGAGALARSGLLRTGTNVISRLASRTAVSSLSIARQNLVRYGIRNIAINTSSQFTSVFMSGGSTGDIDIADIAISGIAGNSFAMIAIGVSLVNFRADGNLSTGFSNPYKGLTDLGTGLFFGAISTQIPRSDQVGKSLNFAAGFTNELWGNLTNWTILQGN